MGKYLPFAINLITIIVTLIVSHKIKDKVTKKYVLCMFIVPQIVYFIGYLKVFLMLYSN